jgi:pimeloyl-ACP methyl ester carboxylesterase
MDYVFLHGGGQGGWVWEPLIDAMKMQSKSAFGRALALDAPGCGAKRDRNTDGVTVEMIADELVSDVEQSGFKDIFIIGHSQAGTVIPMMLERRPDLFSRALYLACVAPAPGKTVQSFRTELFPGEEMPMKATPEEAYRMTRFYMCNDMDEAEGDAFMAKMGKDSWPPLSYAKNDWVYDDTPAPRPTIYAKMLQDPGVPVQLQDIFARRLKADRIVCMDCGHGPMQSRPHGFAEIVLREARGAI